MCTYTMQLNSAYNYRNQCNNIIAVMYDHPHTYCVYNHVHSASTILIYLCNWVHYMYTSAAGILQCIISFLECTQ